MAVAACSGPHGDADQDSPAIGSSGGVTAQTYISDSSEASDPEADDSESPETPAEGSQVSAAEDAADFELSEELAVTSSLLDELGPIIYGWSNPDVYQVGECMHEAGFPQLLESMSESERRYTGPPSPLNSPAYFYGPHTDEQARETGMLGLWTLLASSGGIGNVMTQDSAYFAVLTQCQTDVRGTYSDAVHDQMEALSAEYYDLYNSLSAQFSAAILPEVDLLTRDRMTCVREAGYPILDRDLGLERDRELMLESLAIEAGETGRTAGDVSLSSPLKPGEIRVLLPSQIPRETYVPSAAEVEFALQFVECGKKTDFLERLESIQRHARAVLLAEHETAILGFHDRLEEILFN